LGPDRVIGTATTAAGALGVLKLNVDSSFGAHVFPSDAHPDTLWYNPDNHNSHWKWYSKSLTAKGSTISKKRNSAPEGQ